MKWLLWFGAGYVALAAVAWAVTTEEEQRELELSYKWMRVCQAVARTFGQWGLHAEVAYNEALEAGRLV